MSSSSLFQVSQVSKEVLNKSLSVLVKEDLNPEPKTFERTSPYKALEGSSGGTVSYQDAREFSIGFKDGSGTNRIFRFSLLPAVDDGNETTSIPEIKPGILKKTTMHLKRFTIPGGAPVFQTIGVRETVLQCVGLLIGNEDFKDDSSQSDLEEIYDKNSSLNAYKSALEFDGEVVQKGYQCGLTIASGGEGTNDGTIVIRHNCLVQNFRYFITRSDRVWFSLELVLLDYTPGGSKYSTSSDSSEEDEEENARFTFTNPFEAVANTADAIGDAIGNALFGGGDDE